MAVTAPIDIPAPALLAGAAHASDLIVQGDDLERVRLYGRLAAAIQAAALIVLALVLVRIASPLVAGRWDSGRTLVPLAAAAAAAVRFLLAELRLRSYRLDLTPDAVVFAYGRKRWYVPRAHIQLFDTESSLLLRLFGLRRCNLHTGGGTVVVCPVPARVASAIERLIYEQPATTPADRTDAAS